MDSIREMFAIFRQQFARVDSLVGYAHWRGYVFLRVIFEEREAHFGVGALAKYGSGAPWCGVEHAGYAQFVTWLHYYRVTMPKTEGYICLVDSKHGKCTRHKFQCRDLFQDLWFSLLTCCIKRAVEQKFSFSCADSNVWNMSRTERFSLSKHSISSLV